MTTNNGSDVPRALWQRQSGSPFSMEPDEIRKRLSRFQAESRYARIVAYVLGPAMAIWFAYWLVFTIQAIITRVGLLLLAFGMSFGVGQVWLYNRDRQKALVNLDAAGEASCVEFYRAELLRQRNFNRGAWLWSRLPTFFAGLFFTMWELLRDSNAVPRVLSLFAVSILAILMVWLNYRRSRKLQQKIDAIDTMKYANGAGGPH